MSTVFLALILVLAAVVSAALGLRQFSGQPCMPFFLAFSAGNLVQVLVIAVKSLLNWLSGYLQANKEKTADGNGLGGRSFHTYGLGCCV